MMIHAHRRRKKCIHCVHTCAFSAGTFQTVNVSFSFDHSRNSINPFISLPRLIFFQASRLIPSQVSAPSNLSSLLLRPSNCEVRFHAANFRAPDPRPESPAFANNSFGSRFFFFLLSPMDGCSKENTSHSRLMFARSHLVMIMRGTRAASRAETRYRRLTERGSGAGGREKCQSYV